MTRKLVMLEHLSLDGFLAGPHGEMDWIRGVSDEEMWDYVHPLTAAADADLELVSTRTFSCGVACITRRPRADTPPACPTG